MREGDLVHVGYDPAGRAILRPLTLAQPQPVSAPPAGVQRPPRSPLRAVLVALGLTLGLGILILLGALAALLVGFVVMAAGWVAGNLGMIIGAAVVVALLGGGLVRVIVVNQSVNIR